MRPGGEYTTMRIREDFLQCTDVPRTNVFSRLLLYDFVTGEADIRQVHHDALQDNIIRYCGRGGINIWVGGLTSRQWRSGVNENARLAYQRHRTLRAGSSYCPRRSDLESRFGPDRSARVCRRAGKRILLGFDRSSSYSHTPHVVRPPNARGPGSRSSTSFALP